MPDEEGFDLQLFRALAALREEARAQDSSPITARRAMHRSLARARVAHSRRFWRFRGGMRLRFVLAGAVGAAGAGVVLGGWSASAGSPLHMVQQVRENLSLGFAGADRLQLLLSYADQRLAQWRTASDPAACLAEARMYLSEAQSLLPPDPTTASFERWTADQRTSLNDAQELARGLDDGSVAAPPGSTQKPGDGASSGSSGHQSSSGDSGQATSRPDRNQGPGGGSDGHHQPSPSDSPRGWPSPDHEQNHSPSPSPTAHGD
jgi:hypothetical protein